LDDNQKGSLSARLFAKKINKFNILYNVWNFDTLTFNQITVKNLPGIAAKIGLRPRQKNRQRADDNNAGTAREILR